MAGTRPLVVGVAELTALATGYPASNLKLLIGSQFRTTTSSA